MFAIGIIYIPYQPETGRREMAIGIKNARKIVRNEISNMRVIYSTRTPNKASSNCQSRVTVDAGEYNIFYNGNCFDFGRVNRKQLEQAISESESYEVCGVA